MGKGKDNSSSSDASERRARPITSLKDPSSFAPPPRRATTNAPSSAASSAHLPSQAQAQDRIEEQEPETVKPPPPPVPYRANTTGLTTDNLPPPPTRRNINPNPSDSADGYNRPPVKQKPSLPPRLPPRRDQSEHSSPPPPPPAYEAVVSQNHVPQLNQGAMNRLGNAGVSVPAFGINGGEKSANSNNNSNNYSIPQPAQNELHARFNKMNIGQSQTQPPPSAESPSPTQQHHPGQQPNLERTKTSSKDSLNSFKERHNDQIQAGKQKITGLNEKYGITKRINGFIDDQKSPANPAPRPAQPQQSQQQRNPPLPPPSRAYSTPGNDPSSDAGIAAKRKPPPPPPKKREMQAPPVNHSPSPPPLPLSTKPR